MARGIPFTDDHYRVFLILKLCTSAMEAQVANIMRAMFDGCTMTRNDVAGVTRTRHHGNNILTTPFAAAITNQGTLDEADAGITKAVLSYLTNNPQFQPFLNGVAYYWIQQLGRIPADQQFEIPPNPKELFPPTPRIPDKLLLLLKACTTYMHIQIAEQLCNRIPECRMDPNSVVTALYAQRPHNRVERLINSPFYAALISREELDHRDLALAWLVVRSGQFALPHELSDVGQHYYHVTGELEQSPNWVAPTVAGVLGLEESQIVPRELHFQGGPSLPSSPPPRTSPQPVVTATMDQIIAFGEGRITEAELIAASQANQLHYTPLPDQEGQGQGQSFGEEPSAPFGLSATAALPEIFWDPTEDQVDMAGLQPAPFGNLTSPPMTNVAPFPAEYFQPQVELGGTAGAPQGLGLAGTARNQPFLPLPSGSARSSSVSQRLFISGMGKRHGDGEASSSASKRGRR